MSLSKESGTAERMMRSRKMCSRDMTSFGHQSALGLLACLMSWGFHSSPTVLKMSIGVLSRKKIWWLPNRCLASKFGHQTKMGTSLCFDPKAICAKRFSLAEEPGKKRPKCFWRLR